MGLRTPCNLKETAMVLKDVLVNGSATVLLVMNGRRGRCPWLIRSTFSEKLYGIIRVLM